MPIQCIIATGGDDSVAEPEFHAYYALKNEHIYSILASGNEDDMATMSALIIIPMSAYKCTERAKMVREPSNQNDMNHNQILVRKAIIEVGLKNVLHETPQKTSLSFQ